VPLVTKEYTLYAKWCVRHPVTFYLGGLGERIGGGALQQSVMEGTAAEAPQLTVKPGWSFEGWDSDLENITKPTIIRAIYSFAYQLSADWNLISINLELDEQSQKLLLNKGAMTLDANGKAYVFNGDLTASQAYWVYCHKAEIITLLGTALEDIDFDASLKPGWNFIGTLYGRNPPNNGAVAWGWSDQRFSPTENLLAGRGYWLYCPND